jgi:hypothetical protein
MPTVTQIGRTNVSGTRLTFVVDITGLSATHSNAGETVDFGATLGLKTVENVQLNPESGYVFSYDISTKNLVALGQDDGSTVSLVLPSAQDLSTLTVRALITGTRA